MDSEYRYEVGHTVKCAFTGDHYFIKGRWLDERGVPVYKGVASSDGDYMLFRECEVQEID